ncbi:MAG: hypothetical protein V1934_07235 [Methanobacteriota archaeon]
MAKGTEIILVGKEGLGKIREARIRAVKEELAVLKKEIKLVEKDIEKAKTQASPPWFRIDEIKRGSRSYLEGNIRLAQLEGAYNWLNDLEIDHYKIGSDIDGLRGTLELAKRKELTPRAAYSLIRQEAASLGISIPWKTSVDSARKAYRTMAKMYAPHNYDIYAERLGIGREASSERYKYIILEVGGAYKLLRTQRRGGSTR